MGLSPKPSDKECHKTEFKWYGGFVHAFILPQKYHPGSQHQVITYSSLLILPKILKNTFMCFHLIETEHDKGF